MAIKTRSVPWRKLLSKAMDNFFDAIFPKQCVGCKKEGAVICPECITRAFSNIKFVCAKCEKESLFGKTCVRCGNKSALGGLFYAGYYGNSIIRDAIYAWKYSFVEGVGNILGNIFLTQAEKYRSIFDNLDNPLIQAVPLNRARLLWRGFNQADILAERLAERFGYKKIEVLLRHKRTIPQSELENDGRRLNTANAFSISQKSDGDLKNRTVILVDDIFTSGATMEECARVLKSAGVKEVWGVVLAKG